jgi:hypothetical protein
MVTQIRISRRAGARIAAGAVAALAALCAALMLKGGGDLYFGAAGSDLVSYFYPYRSFVCRWLHRGVYPWWNPHVFSGYPVAETQQMALFHPVSLLTALVLPAAPGLLALGAAYSAMALGVTHAMMRRGAGFAPLAALAATTAFVFGGAFATRVSAGHFTVLGATAAWPAALLAVWRMALAAPAASEAPGRQASSGALVRTVSTGPFARAARALADPGRRRWFLLAAVADSLVVLAGAPQYVVYLVYMQCVAAVAGARRGARISALVLAGAAWVPAALLSAPQWLPTLHYLPYSGRNQPQPSGAALGAEAALAAFELLLPAPFGDDVTMPHIYAKNVWETASYPGVLGLAGGIVCAGTALGRGGSLRRRRARLAVALMLLGLYLAAGGRLPGLASFREPLKARAIAATGLALAAGCAVQGVCAALHARRRAHGARALAFAALAVCVLAVAAWLWAARNPSVVARIAMAAGLPLGDASAAAVRAAMAKPELLTRSFMSAALAATAMAGALALAAMLTRRLPGAAVLAVAALATGDPLVASLPGFVARHPFADAGMPDPPRDWLLARIARSREAGEMPWRVSLPGVISGRTQFHEGMWETGGYDPLMPAGANNRVVLKRAGPEGTPPKLAQVARAVGRRYLLAQWEPTRRLDDYAAAGFEFPGAAIATLERAVAPAVDVAADGYGPDTSGTHYLAPARYGAAGMTNDEYGRLGADRAHMEAILRALAQARHDNPQGDGDTLRMLPQDSPNRFAFDAATSGAALLVLRATWLPGWRATVNGERLPETMCANFWMPAVYLSGGTNRVEFEYRPRGITDALALALLGAGLVALGLMRRGRERRPAR